jgi:16S rRNA G527 N7-methylase RsmG
MDDLLAEGIRLSGIPASKKQIDLLTRYIAEIESWNSHMNLVKASREQLIVKHILD